MKPILAFLLITTVARADITPNHGVQGGLLTGSIMKLTGGSQTACWIGFGVGTVLGMLPDLQWMASGQQHDYDYLRYHSFRQAVSFLPPVTLHIFWDRPFHPLPRAEWPRWGIPVAIAMVFAEILLVYLFAKWIKGT